MRRHLYHNLRIVFQDGHHRIECGFRLSTQRSLIEIIENILNHLRLSHGSKYKVYRIFGILLSHIAHKLLLAVHIAFCACHHHIFHTSLQVKLKCAVALADGFLIAAIVAHNAYHGIWHRLLVAIEHITRNGDFQFRFHKRVDMVISAGIVAVRAKETAFALAKSDAEVIIRRVHRPTHILDIPSARSGERGLKDIQSAQSSMAIACKIEHTIAAHIGETLIARRVYHIAKVFQRTLSFLQVDAPKVLASLSARHIAREIQPSAIGRHCRVTISRQRIGSDFKLHRGAPLGLTALRCVNLHRGGRVEFAASLSKIHRRPIRRKRCNTFIKVSIQFTLGRLWTLPHALLIFLSHIYVAILGACDFALGSTLRLLGRRGEIQLVVRTIEKHRAEIGATRIKQFRSRHLVARGRSLDASSILAATQSVAGKHALRLLLKECLVILHGIFIFALHMLALRQIKQSHTVGVIIAYSIAIGSRCICSHIQVAIALAHPEGHSATQRALLALSEFVIHLLVGEHCCMIFASGILLIGSREFCTAASTKHCHSHHHI